MRIVYLDSVTPPVFDACVMNLIFLFRNPTLVNRYDGCLDDVKGKAYTRICLEKTDLKMAEGMSSAIFKGKQFKLQELKIYADEIEPYKVQSNARNYLTKIDAISLTK